jgi:ACS family tartrate transporter-like MFS transporter
MSAPSVHPSSDVGRRAVRRVTGRLMPFLLLLYFVAYLDRANVSYAGLEMTRDLGFTDTVFGLGAGLFFVGYFLFEVPGTVLVESWSARRWFARIMVSWGLCAAACGLIHTARSFYTLRLLLGAFEAGFAPGIVVYLTHWFLHRDRGRAMALFLIGIPLSGVIGAPLSGLLLKAHWLGLAGWRWVFIGEGLPAVLLGVVTFFYLTDWPREARWLRPEEREWLQRELQHEDPGALKQPGFRAALGEMGHLLPGVLASAQVLLLMAIYFFGVTALYGLTIWMPKLIQGAARLTDQRVTTLVAVPYLTALVAMLLAGRSSDRTAERRWHTIVPIWAAGLGLAGSVLLEGRLDTLLPALCLGTAGVCAFIPTFWALTTSQVAGRRGAIAVGLINSTGNLGGFVGPYVMGYLRTSTGTYSAGLLYLVVSALIAGALVLGVNMKRLADVS